MPQRTNKFIGPTQQTFGSGTNPVSAHTLTEWTRKLYQEKDFVPEVAWGTGTTPASGVTNDGYYGQAIKIGNIVFFNLGFVLLNKGGGTGTFNIIGFPFLSDAKAVENGVIVQSINSCTFTGLTGTTEPIKCYIDFTQSNSSGQFYPRLQFLNGDSTALTDANISPISTIRASGFYFT